jgi:hypothetical protein
MATKIDTPFSKSYWNFDRGSASIAASTATEYRSKKYLSYFEKRYGDRVLGVFCTT